MTSEGLGEVFEGDSADMCAGKFPLMSMGGRADRQACADGERGPPSARPKILQIKAYIKKYFSIHSLLSTLPLKRHTEASKKGKRKKGTLILKPICILVIIHHICRPNFKQEFSFFLLCTHITATSVHKYGVS